jgi:hypothetical protein
MSLFVFLPRKTLKKNTMHVQKVTTDHMQRVRRLRSVIFCLWSGAHALRSADWLSFSHIFCSCYRWTWKLNIPQLVTRFLSGTNVCLVEIHMWIVEMLGEGSMNRGNMRKWCRLLKEGSTIYNHMSLSVHTHYWTVQVGNFSASSIHYKLCTTWLSLVSPPQEIFEPSESEEWPRHRMLGTDLFQRRLPKAGPMIWQVPEVTWWLCRSSLMYIPTCCKKYFLKIL